MNKKNLILVALCVLILGSTTALTASDWAGTFWGDATGTWSGTLFEDTDPPYFRGIWDDGNQRGAMYGDAEEVQNGVFEVHIGYAENNLGTLIGYWNGTFNTNTDTASGDWAKVDMSAIGRWAGTIQ